MTPFCRVSWVVPDQERRAKAVARLTALPRHRAELDPQDIGHRLTGELEDPEFSAGTTHHGVLMSEVVYVPGHEEPREIRGSLPARHTTVVPPRWVCLVATKSGTHEMDPRDLTVTGVWFPGEPLEPE